MRHIRYKILTRLGIWFKGIYAEDGELVDVEMEQTPIRRFLNHVWDFLKRHGADDEEPCPHWDFPRYIPIVEAN